jgi:tripartite-type tricarboxylate transporter receptor subunit TctC
MAHPTRSLSRPARRALLLALAFTPLAGIAPAAAQVPSRPIKLVVPFAPGGGQDAIARYLATELAARLGTAVVVENKAGAGGVLAADAVAKGPADGTSLLLASGGAISIAPHLQPKLPYQAQQDFVPVAMVADTPMVVAVRTQSPLRTLGDMVQAAKAQPGTVTYASTGNGTVSHLTGELLAQGAGMKLTHVAYKGASPAIVDLLSGQVAAIVTSAASIETMVEGGKARVLATFTNAPLSSLPGVPTVQQAIGASGLAVPVWSGLLAPAKTPRPVLERLSAEVLAICRLPQTQQRLRQSGAEATCAGSADFARVIADDSERWKSVIQRGGIKAE